MHLEYMTTESELFVPKSLFALRMAEHFKDDPCKTIIKFISRYLNNACALSEKDLISLGITLA